MDTPSSWTDNLKAVRENVVRLVGNAAPSMTKLFAFLVSWWFALSTTLGSMVLVYALWTFISRHLFARSIERTTNALTGVGGGGSSAASTNQQTAGTQSSSSATRTGGGLASKSVYAPLAGVGRGVDEVSCEFTETSMQQQEELLQILRPIRMFCELGNEIIFELIKRIETIEKHEGDMLFNIGQNDDSIYLIQKGILSLEVAKDPLLTDVTLRMKTVTNGDSVYSVLSFVDYLTGHPGVYKTVRCRVLTNSTILRIRFETIATVLNTRPEWLLKCIQIITSRIQRVTFTALNNYLGLNNELLKTDLSPTPPASAPKQQKDQNSSIKINTNAQNFAASPDSSTAVNSDGESPTAQPSEVRFVKHLQHDATFHNGVERLRQYLGIKDAKILHDLKLVYGEVQPNATIIEEDTNSALVYLLTGQLTAYMRHNKFLSDNDLIDPRTAASINPTVLGPTINSSSAGSRKSAELNNSNEEEEVVEVFRANYNQLVGATAILSGETSVMTVRAVEKCVVIVIPRSQFYKAMKREPTIVLPVANSIVARLSPFVRQIDFAIEWSTISSGVRLYRQGDLPSNLYVVISGRFRSFYRPPPPPQQHNSASVQREDAELSSATPTRSEHQRHFMETNLVHDYFDPVPTSQQQQQRNSPQQHNNSASQQQQQPLVFVDEYGNGDLVGLPELSAMERRLTTMVAVRDSEVARIPAEVFEIIKMKFPKVTARVVRMLGMGLMGRCRDPTNASAAFGAASHQHR